MRNIYFMKSDFDQKLQNIGKNVIKCKKLQKIRKYPKLPTDIFGEK